MQGAGEGEGSAVENNARTMGPSLTEPVRVYAAFHPEPQVQAAIESFERCIREYEGQSTHTVPDFVKAGIVVHSIEEQTPRDHLVMHSARLDSCEKLKQEVFDIARGKSALGTASTSSPMEVDALRHEQGKENGKDKGKGKDNDKKKDSQDTDASKAEKTKCFNCEKLGHRKSECQKLAADKGKPHNINELGATESGPPQAAAQQVSSLTVSGRDPEEEVYIWMLARPFEHVFACLPCFVVNKVNLSSSGLKHSLCEWSRG